MKWIKIPAIWLLWNMSGVQWRANHFKIQSTMASWMQFNNHLYGNNSNNNIDNDHNSVNKDNDVGKSMAGYNYKWNSLACDWSDYKPDACKLKNRKYWTTKATLWLTILFIKYGRKSNGK